MLESILAYFAPYPYLWPFIFLLPVLIGAWEGVVERSREITKENLTIETIHRIAGLICLFQAIAGILNAIWLYFGTRYVAPPVNVAAIGAVGLDRVKFLDFQLLVVISIGVALPVLHVMAADRDSTTYRIARTSMLAMAAGTVLSCAFVIYAALMEPDLITALPVQGKTAREAFLWWYSAVPFYILISSFAALLVAFGVRAVWSALRRLPA